MARILQQGESEIHLVNFLTERKSAGLNKLSIFSAKAAILNLWLILHGHKMESPLLKLFMRGVSQFAPVRPNIQGIWDPIVVLELFRRWKPNQSLSLLDLTRKCVVLIALVTAQRVQTLGVLSIKNMTITTQVIAFMVEDRLKQTVEDRETPLIYLPRIPDSKVCVWACVVCYMLRTRKL